MRRLIKTNGTSVELTEPLNAAKIAQLIGARALDTVNLRHLGEPLIVMCIDDDGYDVKARRDGPVTVLEPVRARLPVNAEATRLYHLNCRPGTTHQIVGDVVVLPDDDFLFQ